MGIEVTVRDGLPGRDGPAFTLPDLEPKATVRELIRTRVREEVAKFNAGAGELFGGLVMPEGAEPARGGYRVKGGRTIDWRKQAEAAEEGFARNRFIVLVGGRQVDDLDEELELTADTDVRFVKLTPLVGG